MNTKNPLDMTADDFRQLGFKAGLEVHQQLNTRQKLFCHCPVGYVSQAPDVEILRHMRPTLSELGEYDGTALMEFKTKKQIRYQLFRDVVCTYEMDDTPPFPINQEALDIGLIVGLLFGCTLVDELHVSRKQYLDGSIPAGFQRTAIVGIDGRVPVGESQVGITQVGLEEDACREVSDDGHTVVFRTDRLSTPLVEVVTEPELTEPAQVPACAQAIRRMLRASERVRRGAGSTRADVNVSIAGGTRVEIKGVPRIAWFERLVRIEACRQKALLDIRDQLKLRGISSRSFNASIRDISDSCRTFRIPAVRRALRRGDTLMGVCLPGFGGLLDQAVQPGIPFAAEFSGRVKVIACLDEMPNLLHTDDPELAELRPREMRKLREIFSARHSDVVILTWGPAEDAHTAAEEIRLRALDALEGVPNETRQPNRDGTTGFERILPGADRMYPDTDSPPVRIEQSRMDRIQSGLPARPASLLDRYLKLGLSAELADDVLLQGPPSRFERILAQSDARPVDVAVLLCQIRVGLLRRKQIRKDPEDQSLLRLCELLAKGSIYREALADLLSGLDGVKDVDDLVKQYSPTPAPEGEIAVVVKSALKAAEKGCRSKSEPARLAFAMGHAMETLRGRAPGALVRQRISRSRGE